MIRVGTKVRLRPTGTGIVRGVLCAVCSDPIVDGQYTCPDTKGHCYQVLYLDADKKRRLAIFHADEVEAIRLSSWERLIQDEEGLG